jgi:hypothetical protein
VVSTAFEMPAAAPAEASAEAFRAAHAGGASTKITAAAPAAAPNDMTPFWPMVVPTIGTSSPKKRPRMSPRGKHCASANRSALPAYSIKHSFILVVLGALGARALLHAKCVQLPTPFDDGNPAGKDNQQQRARPLCAMPSN